MPADRCLELDGSRDLHLVPWLDQAQGRCDVGLDVASRCEGAAMPTVLSDVR